MGFNQIERIANGKFNQKSLGFNQIERIADGKLNVILMLIPLFDRVENIMEKRRKCWLPAFSPFPIMFLKYLFHRVLESQECVVKIQTKYKIGYRI